MKDLTQGSVTRHLLHMSAFLAASMVVQTLYLLADLYWVGRLGKEAIAAVGVAGNITMIVLAVTQTLGVGTTTLISQAAGRKDQPHAELAFNQSFVMSILIALALSVVGFILRPAYCDWLSADVPTAALAKAYLLWFLPGLLLQFPLVALSSALRATGINQASRGIPGAQRSAQYRPRPAVNFRIRSVAKTRSDGRSACHVHFHFGRRCADRNLFRKEISLPAFSFSAATPANKSLGRDTADWCATGRRVFAALRLHNGRLRNHPRLWTSGSGGLRNRRARDAGAISPGGCT